MKVIKLKSNVNWVTHELRSLAPLQPKDNEEVYKIVTDYDIEEIRDDNRDVVRLKLSYGPDLLTGTFIEPVGLMLKEICGAYDSDGDYVYPALIFEK